jgi:hypothetical protein
MQNRYPVVTLCGSSKFKDEYIAEAKRLNLEGHLVLTCNLFNHADELNVSDDVKTMLDEIHIQKIEMSDGIFVINKDGYVGNSTQNEINYAVSLGKWVKYLET